MRFYLLNFITNNAFLHALYKTLVHSLWQGILMAALAGILLMSTKKTATAIRYKLLISLLMAFLTTVIITFCYVIQLPLANTINNTAPVNAYTPVLNNSAHTQSISEKLIAFFQPYENILILLWILIIFLKSVHLLSGLRTTYRLKHIQVFDAGEYWNEALKKLCNQLSITRPVVLMKSALAQVPMVIGHFKPVILFPAAALNSLTTIEVEAVLLHELAHIQRKDYFINLLQTFTEVVFFFNPAVLWVSSLLKDERENCCDDIAIAQFKNKKQFIHALLSFQGYNTAHYAASFAGNKYHLLHRIRRIITNNNKTLNTMEKFLLATGIVVTAFMAVAFTQKNQSPQITTNPVLHSAQHLTSYSNKDTTSPTVVSNDQSKAIINEDINGKQYKLIELNGKISELYIDNVKVPDDKLKDYKPVIDSLQARLNADKQSQVEAMKAQKEYLHAQEDMMQHQKFTNEKLQKDMQQQAEIMNEKALAMQDKIEKELQPQREALEQQQELINKQAKEIQEQVEKEIQPKAEALAKQAEAYNKKAMAIQLKQDIKLQVQKELLEQQAAVMQKQAKQIQDEVEKNIKPQREALEKQAEIMQQKAKQMQDEIEKNIKPQREELEKQAEILKEKALKLNEEMQQQMQSDSTEHHE